MEFHVKGMSCQGCVGSVKRIVAQATGHTAEAIEIDLASGRVQLPGTLEPSSQEQVKAALSKQGFEVGDQL